MDPPTAITTIQASSSSSSSGKDRPDYATADSEWIQVKTWDDDLVATASTSSLTVQWIKYKKLTTGVEHEYLLFDVSDNTLFVTERNNETPPDYTMTKAPEANDLLATLTPSSNHTLPERTFARILTLVSAKAPDYHWYTNNCYWYAGSVYETIQLGLEDVSVDETNNWGHRGKVKPGWWWITVGSDPREIFKS
jgi:hypothetical protein